MTGGNTPYANNSGGFTASVGGNSWQSAPAPTWTGTWAVSPQAGGSSFNQQTLRQIVHTSIGGPAARVEVSNAFGSAPLVIGDVSGNASLSGAQNVSGSSGSGGHPVGSSDGCSTGVGA